MDIPIFKDGRVHFRNTGVKGFTKVADYISLPSSSSPNPSEGAKRMRLSGISGISSNQAVIFLVKSPIKLLSVEHLELHRVEL